MNEVKKLIILALLLVTLSGTAAASDPFYPDKDPSELNTFSSYAEPRLSNLVSRSTIHTP